MWGKGMTYRRCAGSKEDQRTKVRSTLVAESTSSVDQSTNTVGLDGRAKDGAAVCGGGTSSLLRLEEFLLGVGFLCLPVGVSEHGRENTEGDDVVEEGTNRDGGGLDGRKVYITC